MATLTARQAILLEAVAKSGSPYAAALCLGAPESVIAGFIDGWIPVPDYVLLRAVDIVLEDFGRRQSSTGAALRTSA
jgi:hypothetical protein